MAEPACRFTEDWMATTIAAQDDIQEVWKKYKEDPNSVELRNRLIEQYLHWSGITLTASGNACLMV